MKKIVSTCFLIINAHAMLKTSVDVAAMLTSAAENTKEQNKRLLVDYLSDTAMIHEPRVVELLLEYGALVNQVDDRLNRPVIGWVALTGNVAIMHAILGTGKACVNSADNDGRTPLMLAARLRHVDMVELLLLQAGIAVKLFDKRGYSASDYAKSLAEDEELGDAKKYAIVDLLGRAEQKLRDGKKRKS